MLENSSGYPTAYAGPRHFDYKPPRTEDAAGVWVTAAACMRNYLILKDKVSTFRDDPEVSAAMAAARVDELSVPTLMPGESLATLRAEEIDVDVVAARGMAFERLDQLAMEHLLGGPAVRSLLDPQPRDTAVAPDGTIYVTDTYNHRIRKIAPNGTITTIAGTGSSTYNGDNIAATSASRTRP